MPVKGAWQAGKGTANPSATKKAIKLVFRMADSLKNS